MAVMFGVRWRASAMKSYPVREADIAEDDVHFTVVEKTEAAGHAIARENGMPPAPKNSGERSLRIEMILDEKDGTHDVKPTSSRRPLHSWFGYRSFAGRVFPDQTIGISPITGSSFSSRAG
jgi:hypothetical protein